MSSSNIPPCDHGNIGREPVVQPHLSAKSLPLKRQHLFDLEISSPSPKFVRTNEDGPQADLVKVALEIAQAQKRMSNDLSQLEDELNNNCLQLTNELDNDCLQLKLKFEKRSADLRRSFKKNWDALRSKRRTNMDALLAKFTQFEKDIEA
ncbi:MAG: hypothetical protein SGARI_007783 [Bacillariaceae sp.]